MLHEEATAVNPEHPTRRTQAERRAATRGALIDAARALFAEKGFAGAGREEIVERAGVTRGAMYHHFASKESLFQAVYEAVEEESCTALIGAGLHEPDPVARFHLGARAFLESAATPEMRRIVLLDAPAVLAPEVRRVLSERFGLGIVRIGLDEIAKTGRLAIGPIEPLARVLLAALHEAALVVAEGGDAAEMHAVVDGLIDRITT